jgi:hypothetical protein
MKDKGSGGNSDEGTEGNDGDGREANDGDGGQRWWKGDKGVWEGKVKVTRHMYC